MAGGESDEIAAFALAARGENRVAHTGFLHACNHEIRLDRLIHLAVGIHEVELGGLESWSEKQRYRKSANKVQDVIFPPHVPRSFSVPILRGLRAIIPAARSSRQRSLLASLPRAYESSAQF